MPNSTPLQFDVPEVHCQACVDAVTAAVRQVDPGAAVSVDLDTKRVVIGSASEAQDLVRAIEEAGYEVKAAA